MEAFHRYAFVLFFVTSFFSFSIYLSSSVPELVFVHLCTLLSPGTTENKLKNITN